MTAGPIPRGQSEPNPDLAGVLARRAQRDARRAYLAGRAPVDPVADQLGAACGNLHLLRGVGKGLVLAAVGLAAFYVARWANLGGTS